MACKIYLKITEKVKHERNSTYNVRHNFNISFTGIFDRRKLCPINASWNTFIRIFTANIRHLFLMKLIATDVQKLTKSISFQLINVVRATVINKKQRICRIFYRVNGTKRIRNHCYYDKTFSGALVILSNSLPGL